jgi:hypothetical protein
MHLGATDAPFTTTEARRGTLLHQLLRSKARELRGLDRSADAIEFLRSEFGIDDIECADLSRPLPGRPPLSEVVICGDIVEHVDDAGVLLDNCGALLEPGGRLALTTINGLALKAALRCLLGREAVHPDHVAYYSFATLRALLARHGFAVEEARFFCYPAVTKLSAAIFSAIYRLAPQAGDGIIVVARKAYATSDEA